MKEHESKFARKGTLWRLYGVTKTHFWGVSIVSTVLGSAGLVLALYSFLFVHSVQLLLFAACCLLCACWTVLYSILMLLFYLSSANTRDDSKPPI
jgi:hypothetical protein